MNPLFEAAEELLDTLDALGLSACLIGGLVVERWGEPRLTRDVDATVLAEYGAEAPVVDAVLSRLPARRPDAREFALSYRVLLLKASNGVDLDLSLAAFDFEREVLERATTYEFSPGIRLRTCSAEDLIVYKAVAGRARDIADIETVVIRQGRVLDVERVRAWLRFFAELKEDPKLPDAFEHALRKAAQR
jgi:predicted nucleotidyltransferase